jgi:hypothetical protein
MAKKNASQRPPSKAQAVREFRRQNPEASNDQVVAALKTRGIEITPNYVSVVKSQDKMRERKKAGAAATPPRRPVGGVGVEQIKLAARLIRACGGAQEAKGAIEAAEEVARALHNGR